ncbi:MAG: hypothetical protein EXR17_05930 [Flavobacteriaceae bacterium]|nr:hypothetical protein [Flavobacteriaceae bacterium]
MKRFFTIISVCLGLCSFENLAAQGCVAIRGFGGCGVAGGAGLALVSPGSGKWVPIIDSLSHFDISKGIKNNLIVW